MEVNLAKLFIVLIISKIKREISKQRLKQMTKLFVIQRTIFSLKKRINSYIHY